MDLCKRYNQMVEKKHKKPKPDKPFMRTIILDNCDIISSVDGQEGDILWVWTDDQTETIDGSRTSGNSSGTITSTSGGSFYIDFTTPSRPRYYEYTAPSWRYERTTVE